MLDEYMAFIAGKTPRPSACRNLDGCERQSDMFAEERAHAPA